MEHALRNPPRGGRGGLELLRFTWNQNRYKNNQEVVKNEGKKGINLTKNKPTNPRSIVVSQTSPRRFGKEENSEKMGKIFKKLNFCGFFFHVVA